MYQQHWAQHASFKEANCSLEVRQNRQDSESTISTWWRRFTGSGATFRRRLLTVADDTTIHPFPPCCSKGSCPGHFYSHRSVLPCLHLSDLHDADPTLSLPWFGSLPPKWLRRRRAEIGEEYYWGHFPHRLHGQRVYPTNRGTFRFGSNCRQVMDWRRM